MPGESSRDILAEQMASGRKVLVPILAEMLKTSRVKEVDTSEERRLFWEPAITDEEEDRLWADAMIREGINGPVTPEMLPLMTKIGLEISHRKFPDRWDMAGAEGRNTDAQTAEWALKHALKGRPGAQQETQQSAPVAEGEGY